MSAAATVTELLLDGRRHGDRTCFTLVSAENSRAVSALGFEELVERGTRAAAALRDAGVGRGARVVIAASPNPDWIVAFVGTILAGGVAVPVNHRYRERELAAVIGASDPAVVVVDAETRAPALGAIAAAGTRVLDLGADTTGSEVTLDPVEVDPDDLAVILHTSGTTGTPKGVERTHGEYALFMQRWSAHTMRPDDRVMNFLPLYHQAGLVCGFLCSYARGIPMFHVDKFNRDTFWHTVDEHRLTWTVLMQPVPRYLLDLPPDQGDRNHSLQWVLATMSPDDWVRFQERFGVSLNSSYGSTESTIVRMTGTRDTGPVDPARIHGPLGGALCGRPFDTWGDARVVTDEGEPAAPEEVGMIEARGETVFKRYFRNEEASAGAFSDGGWFRTGDRGYVSKAGDLYLLERVSAVIRRSGENIAPREIEEVLELHPAVAEAAAVGVPDELRGQEIAAFVVLRPGSSLPLEELFGFCGEHLAAFKVPRFLEARDSLPHTATFKVRRDALKVSEAAVDRLEALAWPRHGG
jgi:crotonobetaine/carnitine-CoA ligase